MTTPTAEPRPYRVAVIRALPGLGDFLCAVPALRALRAALPFACIDLIGLPSMRPLVHRFRAYVDRLVEFPGFPGIPEVPFEPARLLGFLNATRRDPYDLVIQMHGDGSCMNAFAQALGTPLVYGYRPIDMPEADAECYLPYVAEEPEVRRNVRLVRHIGAPSEGEHLEFPLTPLDAAELAMLPETAELRQGRYAVVHPGASVGEKRWQPEHFAHVADRLACAGITPVLTGVISESPVSFAVMSAMETEPIDLTGRTSLGAMAVLVSGAALVVGNDTGVSHLADALAVPSIVVFSASDPRRWAPLDTTRHRVVDLTIADEGYDDVIAEVLAHAAGWDDEVAWELEPHAPLAGVMAEVEYLLSIGGGSVS